VRSGEVKVRTYIKREIRDRKKEREKGYRYRRKKARSKER
jgi:hypothetical protein